jgi:hypothetical protein
VENIMNQQRIQLFAAVAITAALTASASAQNPFPYTNPAGAYQPQRPPVLSPYLNLNNRGNPAVNYYNFVQPQLQLAQPFVGNQGPALPAYQAGDEAVLDPHDPTSIMPRPSGHPSTFNSTGAYFNSLGTIGSGFGRPGGGVQAPPTQIGRRR